MVKFAAIIKVYEKHDMHPLLNIAQKAAFAAGEVATRNLYKLDTMGISEKSAGNFVSEVDLLAEQTIIDIIRKAHPSHAILTEESGFHEGSQKEREDECVWIIDPIDGTNNYLHGIPHYAVSIAVQIKNRIEHAVVYDPSKNECFTASRGGGVRCNDIRLRVSPRTLLSESLLGASFSCHDQASIDHYIALFKIFSAKCLTLRRMGSGALDLAYVAAGRLDGLWALGLQPWDCAAGSLLVREAGGLVSDFQGAENYLKNQQIVAGNPKIFKIVLQAIQQTLAATSP